MELKRMSICLALFVLACISHCSEARHSLVRRGADEVNYDELQNDEGADDEAQNDAEGNDEEDTAVVAKIVTQSALYNVTIGRTVRLECLVSPATASVVVQWTRNNTKYFIGTQKDYEQDLASYSVGDRFSIAANSTDLLIREVRPSDSGIYTCGILQFKPVHIQHHLVVVESPRILMFTATNNGQLVEGSDLVLTCKVSGSPPPKIVWSRGEGNVNKRLQENDATYLGNTLTIKNVRRSHSGSYYCYAFNGVGTNQSEVHVVVRGKPRVHVERTVVNSAIGVEAILECAVHDDAASYIRWYKDGQRIEDSSRAYSISSDGQRSNLSVIPRHDDDFGTFTCEAENEQGSHNRSIDLVQSPVLEDLQVDGPKISLTIHSHQPVEVIELQLKELDGDAEWKTLNVPVPQSRNTHEYQVDYSLEDHLSNGGKYEVTVKVKNDKSWSAHTNPAVIEYVLPGGSAHSLESTPIFLATALMYLLVRM
ncbi:lachesin-like isoform X2 [Maniola jurtina]|uniref:lachesin-like isoform X2 n=1 Tax=Maniola jurtina TaxID=191418 RepID=UPI001E6875AF|nr:lachesin-like isoform X2 [Maniola jurtina]